MKPLRNARPLLEPQPLRVRATPDGRPTAVLNARWRVWRTVTAVPDRWRTDDLWWRERPISRMYHQVELDNGTTLTIYHDLVDGSWWLATGH